MKLTPLFKFGEKDIQRLKFEIYSQIREIQDFLIASKFGVFKRKYSNLQESNPAIWSLPWILA